MLLEEKRNFVNLLVNWAEYEGETVRENLRLF